MRMLLNRAGDDVIYQVLDIKWLATENIMLTEWDLIFLLEVYDRIPNNFITDKYAFFNDGM